MDEEKPHSIGSIATRIGCTLVGLLLMYALSMGPVVYFVDKYAMLPPIVESFYKPLGWALHATSLGEPFQGYLNWWMSLNPKNRVD